ncbi:MAG: alternative ribosome rescue aminoacyl-tRNA hydrolase ArfB [Gemmatimonadota bacterium]|nr:alternative ribosome rescue aminoacyl-tRNA hydrolase ArfB [Gemmatimonadota bacterium]
MPREARLPITPALSLPWTELEFRATRSGGPGGQHVNTSSTRVELWWNPGRSSSLSEEQRHRIRAKLAHRLSEDGWLRVVASATRSQHRNRELAIERFQSLMARALELPKARKATKPTAGSRARRLEQKRRRGLLKRTRRLAPEED